MTKSNTATAHQPVTASPKGAPRVLVTGEASSRCQAIADELGDTKAVVKQSPWQSYPHVLDESFDAVVVAEPKSTSMAGAIAAVRGHPAGGKLALYAVVDRDRSSRKTRASYLAGATAVLEWPREREIMVGIIAETLGMNRIRGHASEPDTALSRTIRAHLRLGPKPGKGVKLSTRNGAVALSGEAPSLAKLKEIVETTAAVPGVKQVLPKGLRVAASGLSDAKVRQNIESVIRATSKTRRGSFAITVRGGQVELRGTAESRAQFHELLDLIAEVDGVRDLDWKVTFPGEESLSDGAVTRRLRQALRVLHPKAKVEARVMAGVAELTGVARSLAIKRAIARYVDRVDGIKRVVDKIQVLP